MTANAKARSTEQTAQAKNVRTSRSTSPTERPQKKSSATEEIQANAAHLATKTMHTKTQQNAAHRSHGGAAVAGLTEALAAFSTAAQHRMPWRNACAAHWSQWPPKGRGARRLKASSRSSAKVAQQLICGRRSARANCCTLRNSGTVKNFAPRCVRGALAGSASPAAARAICAAKGCLLCLISRRLCSLKVCFAGEQGGYLAAK